MPRQPNSQCGVSGGQGRSAEAVIWSAIVLGLCAAAGGMMMLVLFFAKGN